jgi:hypothetical protein
MTNILLKVALNTTTLPLFIYASTIILLSMTGQEKGDLLIQASACAGLTVLYLSSDESIHVSVTFT